MGVLRFRCSVQEIKKYASIVALDHQLIDPVDEYTHTFLATKTSAVDTARSLNMTVFYHSLANEYVAYAADYRSDPMLQINSLIENFKIDGFITDFPATLHAFLHSEPC
jgi:glycerophosphoryl diester phosphodiesterase